ncbi:MAG: hypothetical protein IPI65_10935 [Bacteroidetes bacterium]|nr:hypothetical protein [Bacteroidota bacterium]
MRKIKIFIIVIITGVLASCSEKKVDETETLPETTTTTETKTVEVETKDPQKIYRNHYWRKRCESGNKNGDNKTSIEIKDGTTEIEIKKKD